MSIINFTTKGFDKNSSVSPDNYYLNECVMILDSIFKNIEQELNTAKIKFSSKKKIFTL